eukprot:s5686_g3.t3
MRPATNASSMVRKSKKKGAEADSAEAPAASKPEALKRTSSRRAASPASRPPAKADVGRQSSMQEVLKRQRRVKDQKEEWSDSDPVVIESEEEGGATSSRRPQLLTTPKTHSRPASKMASPMPDASSPEEPTPKRSRITTKTSKNHWHDNLIRDPSMNTIKVDINKKLSRISVWNNGRGLPVQVHKEHRCYVPTLVFGHLLTSDNYDDSEKKVVGGRNGYGAKLTNIYSKRFIVETADSGSRSKFRQRWGNNMRQADEPEIVPYKGKATAGNWSTACNQISQQDFTAVSFEPDLQRFGMTHLEESTRKFQTEHGLVSEKTGRHRGFDGAPCVFLNGKCLEVDSFEERSWQVMTGEQKLLKLQDYVSLFLDPDDFRISEACNERWEVAIALTDGSGFRQVSFVNSICTSRGCTHVNCVAEQVVAAVMEELAKEKGAKGTLAVKPQHVKNHLWVFETLTTKKERFGSTCELSEELLQAVCGSGIVETLLEWSKALGKSELARHLNKSVMPALSSPWSSFGLHPRMQGPGNNANNIRMGVPNMMMGMGQGMRMPMGMPMMGMPMMGMMGMPMNPMMAMPMNPMMGMGMNAGMGAQSPSPSGQGADRSAGVSPAASTAVVPPKVDTQPIPESKVLPPGLPPGVVPPGVVPPGVVHRERSRSRDAVRVPAKAEQEPEPAREPTPPREKTPPRCHLHNTKKPNTKCKFCQRWLASQSQAQPESDKADKEGKHKDDKSKPKDAEKAQEDEEDYSRRTFKCSSLLKDQIFGSSYFKSLLEISDLDPLTEEIAKYADTLDVYNSGNNVHPSCFICQVYRLFTLPQSEDLDELLAHLDANPSAKVRCAAFLYVRFVVPPHKLWDKLDEALFDDQELKYVDGDKQVTTTIREYVENLLVKDRYYNTPLPRIPVKVRQHLEKELAPLSQFRKRMAAVQRELPPKKVAGTAVEVYVDGNWLPGHIKSYVGQHKRKVSIQLDDGAMVQSHLGKVVLRDEEVSDKDKEKDKDDKEQKDEDEKKEGDEEEKTKDEDHDQRKKKKDKKDDRDSSRSRSRSRSRHRSRSRSRRRRGSSPDWARYKGSMDPSEIERLREKAREEAVVGVGKAYSKRPTTVEGEMWRGSGSEGRVSMLGGSHSYSSTRSSGAKGPSDTEIRSRISREEEEEHKRRMREIYEKYGSVSKATSGNTGTQRSSEIDQPDDANKAGTKQSRDCTLIITEGDSAKALAVAGLSIVGRDHYGVFPLRGKLRNVRELTEKQMMDNKEIEALMKIMAFDASKKYQDASGLRYGSLMIMTDQDFDGSHIKGLVINFIEHWFPDLLQCEGFLREFVTPIVKVSRGDEVVTFFTVAEYEAWKQANNGGTGWACKYYKGLGTSTSAEAREYFSDLEQHELTFLAGEKDNDLIDMAFHPRKADARKEPSVTHLNPDRVSLNVPLPDTEKPTIVKVDNAAIVPMLTADGLSSVFQRLAQTQPKAPAVLDRTGVWNYAQLWDSAGRISCFFAERGLKASPSTEFAPRPIAIFLRQGREWYATCIAAWILGIPVVALSSDLPSGQAEAERAKRVATELKPLALVSDDSAFEVPCLPEDCLRLSLEEVHSAITSCNGRKPTACASPESVLCYVYTGGTTRHSKCVAVTHAMALWEIQQYKTALGGLASEGDRMLQYSSAYWGAAIFGQADLALAFGACNVMIRASAPEEIAAICAEHQISVLGIVPSQLRGAWPGGPSTRPRSLRVLIAWAEKIQPKLAKEWLQHLPVIEILIASEYWLCLSSVGCRTWKDPDDGMERHVLDPLPDLDIKLLKDNGSEAEAGESGEMFLAGPTVFAGYVGADGRISCPNFRYLDAKRYYGTRDRLKRVPGGRGLVYLGRTDSLAKAGGAWQDLEAVEAAAAEVPGVSAAALVACDGSTDAYLVLEDMRDGAGRAREGPPLTAVLDNAMQKLKPAAGNSRPHIWARLPLHPATSKVNRQVLLAQRSEATARETNWHERLHSLQRRMLRGYAAWHVLFGILMLLRASVETPAPTPTLLLDILGRAMLLPYVWGVLLYLWHGTSKQKRNWVNMTMPMGPPDVLAVLVLAPPTWLLWPCILLASAVGLYRFLAVVLWGICVAAPFQQMLSFLRPSATVLERRSPVLGRPGCVRCAHAVPPTATASGKPVVLDRLCRGWSIHQIRGGYRFNGDDILLAREAWHAAPAARNLLDLGAGTGSVGLFWLAQQPGQSRLTALEAQEESSELLNRSIQLLGLEPRVHVIHGDLRDEGIVQGLQAKYDLVTANPPYILPGDRKLPAHSQRRYCYYELRGGPREFAQTASRSLSEEGKFCIVHVASRSADVDRSLADVGLKTVRRLTAFSRGEPKWQVLVCSRSPSDLAVDEEELIVRDELSWIRDRDAVAVATALVLCVGIFRVDLLILGIVGLYLQRPSRMCFLLSLPSAYVLSFPKWCRDEFIYRSMWRGSYLRRFILRWVPILQKPDFDGSISFQPKSVAYDWGSDERWVNVYLERTQKDDKSTVGFWEPVRPAVLPRVEPEADIHLSNGVAASSGASGAPSASRAESSSLEATLAILVGRVGGRPPSLASLDSLQSIRLVELVQRELGLVATSAMVLRSADVHALAEAIQCEGSQARQDSRQEEGTQPDEEGAYRLYIMEFGKSPVDWCVRYGGPGHLDVDALQRASDRACARHSALRTMELRDEGMREAMDRAAAMWQLVCSAHGTTSWRWSAARRAMRALLFAAWPRTFLKSAHDARVQVRLPDRELVVRDPTFAELSDADYMFWIVTPLRNDHHWPYQICAIPVVRKGVLPPGVPLAQAVRTLPPEDVTWYIYAGITHAYSDGASGNALLTDLLRIYAEEANLDLATSTELHSPPEHLALLQHRLRRSLFGRLRGEDNANDDVYHEIVCEDWGRRFGFSKRIKLEPIVVNTLLLAASNVIGCSIDVAWLTAVIGSLLRLFPDQHCFQLILKCACRDGPGQNEMVGFLSEQRVFPIDVGDSRHATLMDVYCAIESVYFGLSAWGYCCGLVVNPRVMLLVDVLLPPPPW